MISLVNVKTLDDQIATIDIPSTKDLVIKADNLLMLPGLLDPHITCGPVESDEWFATIQSAIKGGITGLLDIPSLCLHYESTKDLEKKEDRAEKRLSKLKIPFRYLLYGAAKLEGNEVGFDKSYSLGTILCLTPECLDFDELKWNKMFQLAAFEDLPVVINTKNENRLDIEKSILSKAILFAEKHDARLFVLNVHTQIELEMIVNARQKGVLVYAETTPQYLFPQDGAEVDFLWDGLKKGIIESVGSGYSNMDPSCCKIMFQGKEFDFLNPLFLLPMLLTAHFEGKISLENLVRVTRVNLLELLKIDRKSKDCVLVDMAKEHTIKIIANGRKTDRALKGWPVYTIMQGEVFAYPDIHKELQRIG